MTTTISTVPVPASSAPVIHEADVIVAGAGIAGIFAALAAAREGASTVLIDRYGSVGGNYGPGLGARHDMWQHPSLLEAGLGGAVGAFFAQLEAQCRSRAPRFHHARETAAWQRLLADL